jgi:hypothetical protein
MFRPCIPLALAIFLTSTVHAQELDGVVYTGVYTDGDTVLQAVLPSAVVEATWTRKSRRQAVRYSRLMYNVLKVYPYARITGQLLREYEHDLQQIGNEADRDLYMKLAEAELRAEYEAEVKNLTLGQGRVLLKLIDRETGNTSFELVKQLRGSFQAFVLQSLARLFGHDLKSRYDVEGEDRFVEHIVQRIERGELVVEERGPRTAKAQARLERRRARLYKRYGLSASATTP